MSGFGLNNNKDNNTDTLSLEKYINKIQDVKRNISNQILNN
jgi:hypothetical protein